MAASQTASLPLPLTPPSRVCTCVYMSVKPKDDLVHRSSCTTHMIFFFFETDYLTGLGPVHRLGWLEPQGSPCLYLSSSGIANT